MTDDLAPIILFVYNRPWHTQQTIEALQKNELANESELYIYSDEAKNEDARNGVDAVRQYIENIDGFKKVTIIKREKNWGLANSIIDGVTNIVNKYGKIIVLEDDLITSPNFLLYMNQALKKYKNEKNVYSITGYSFTDQIENIDSTYFLAITSSWSWTTWAEKWKQFERDPEELKKFIKNKSNHSRFNFDNSYDFVAMARNQLAGKIDSWAIYWYFSIFQVNGLTLYPKKSLVQNIGFDGSGTHCGSTLEEHTTIEQYIPVLTDIVEEKKEYRNIVVTILSNKKSKLLHRIISKIKTIAKDKLPPLLKVRLFQVRDKVKLFYLKKDIGENTFIDRTVHITGWNSVKIGKNSAISEYSWLNVNNRTPNHKHIVIGNNCYIGRRNFFSSGWLIEVADYCMTGIDCKLMGSDHIFSDPLKPYIATGTTNENVIKLGTNVWLGAGVTVIGNITIGYGSIIGAGALVNKDIPPFSIAVGNPCKVIKRFDFKQNRWVKMDENDRELDKMMPNEIEYKKILKNTYDDINIPLQACSKSFGDMF